MKSILLLCSLIISLLAANAALVAKAGAPKRIGQKVVVKLTMKNTFKETVQSARAEVFLLDDQGKVVGQAARWVIGGSKDRPALSPDKEATFNFVIEAGKPFAKSQISFSRIVLEGGKLADANKDVQIQNSSK